MPFLSYQQYLLYNIEQLSNNLFRELFNADKAAPKSSLILAFNYYRFRNYLSSTFSISANQP